MAAKDITPLHKFIPAVNLWTTTFMQLQDQVITSNTEIGAILKENNLGGKIAIDISSGIITKAPQEFASFVKKCNSLRTALAQHDPEWLSYWEVINATIFDQLREIIAAKIQIAAEKHPDATQIHIKDHPFKSFHIGDNDAHMVDVVQNTIRRLMFETQAHFNWTWLANHSVDFRPQLAVKYPAQWVVGVDGEGRCGIANLRAWKNKILINIKKPDLITSGYLSVYDSVAAMIFALITLGSGGNAIIRVPNFANISTITIAHLFSNCFENTTIHTDIMNSAIYICGLKYNSGHITSKHQPILFDFLKEVEKNPDVSLYTDGFFKDESITRTISQLQNIQREIFERRINQYAKMITLFQKINGSTAASAFASVETNMINDAFPDISDSWAMATGLATIFPKHSK